jgi:hypothetical protein
LQSVIIIHSANGGKGEGCLVEEYSIAQWRQLRIETYKQEIQLIQVAKKVFKA